MPSIFEATAGKAIGYTEGFTPVNTVNDGDNVVINAPAGSFKRTPAAWQKNDAKEFGVIGNSFIDKHDIILINASVPTDIMIRCDVMSVEAGKFKVQVTNKGEDLAEDVAIDFAFVVIKNRAHGFKLTKE